MTTSFYKRQQNKFLGDSVVLDATLYNNDKDDVIPQSDIQGVTFTIMKPTDPQGVPSVQAAQGQIVADGHGQFIVPGSVNTDTGHYRAIATFTYNDGLLLNLTETVLCNYEITNAFDTTGASPADPYIDQAWMKIEDTFDSDLGGPWLREMTMDVFDKYKLRQLLPEVLLAINTQEMPFSNYTEAGFPYAINDGGALLAQGLLVATIRHLMRSYAEQPDITNSPVAFENRQRYQQTWAAVYQIELDRFNAWLKRWKLRDYDISHASLLVSSKSGRLLTGPMRTRGIMRGGF